MTSIGYHEVTGENGVSTLTTFNPNLEHPIVQTSSNHPNYAEIKAGLDAGDEGVWDLFDIGQGLARKFHKITERVTFDGSDILFDGDVSPALIAGQIRRGLETGALDDQAVRALALFWEKLESNPNEHSREQAYNWFATHDFKVTPEGDVVAYKGVYSNPDGGYLSSSSGTAYVNGVKHTGRIPQNIGDEVSMPRSNVAHDPAVACHYGLHVGDWSYASDFASETLEVHVNPRDIVSVPTDCSARKVRTCKYRVVAEVNAEHEGRQPVLAGAVTGWADVGYAGV